MNWSAVIDFVLKGSFGVILLRSLIEGVRHSFTSRSREVLIAKLLRSDIEATIGRVNSFSNALQRMVALNVGVTNMTYQVDTTSLPPILGTYNQNYSEIYRLMNKYSPENVQDLNNLFVNANNYNDLLTSYRQLFLLRSGVSERTDPNIRYQSIFNSLAIVAINQNVAPVYDALGKIEKGSKIWQFLRSPQIYKIVAIIAGFLFVFQPERDSI